MSLKRTSGLKTVTEVTTPDGNKFVTTNPTYNNLPGYKTKEVQGYDVELPDDY